MFCCCAEQETRLFEDWAAGTFRVPGIDSDTAAWPNLLEVIKAGILALIHAKAGSDPWPGPYPRRVTFARQAERPGRCPISKSPVRCANGQWSDVFNELPVRCYTTRAMSFPSQELIYEAFKSK